MGGRTVSSDEEEEFEEEDAEDVQDNEVAADEEEDEDDEEEGQDEYEKDDFIVDDVEEEEEAKASSDEELRAKKKKRKKRDAEENYELDEDDYELLQEANVTGFHRRKSQASKTKFKRLKKPGRIVSEDGRDIQMGFSDDEDMEESNRHGRTAEEELKRTLFGDDEGAPPEDIGEEEEPEEEEDIGEEDEMADFIVDEEEVDENGQPVRRRKTKKRGPRQASGISSMALQEAQDIFGDVSELLDRRKHGLTADRGEDEEGIDEDGEGYPIGRPSKKKLEEEFEPSVLEEKYMTEKDNCIRETDVPERLQLLEEVIGVVPAKEPKFREADWIYDRAFGQLAIPLHPRFRNLSRMDKTEIVQQISHVLTQLHDYKLEISFIGMYRKEGCLSLLEEGNAREEESPRLKDYKALWQVLFWDKKWWLLQRRKDALQATYEKRARIEALNDSTKLDMLESLLETLQEAESEVAVDDIDAKFNLNFPPDELEPEQGQFKRPKRRSFYSTCHKAGLSSVSKHFGLTPEEFGENLQAMYKRHEVEDSSSTPEDIGIEHYAGEFTDTESVLRGARHMAAVEISTEPAVREYVRNMFSEKAVVNTKPTKEGNSAIGPLHEYAVVKWLQNKPVYAFDDGQWMLIQKAEEEKLLEVTVGLPKDVISGALMKEFETLYLSDGVSRTVQLWNEQRKQILKDAVSAMLLPFMEKETRTLLTARAKQWAAWECGAQIWKKVSIAPHACPKSDPDERAEEDQAPRVMACCWGDKPPTTFVMLDSAGEIVNTLCTPLLRHKKGDPRKKIDQQRLLKFVMEYQPHAVVLGAANVACRYVKDDIFEAIFKIVEEHPRDLAEGLDIISFDYLDEGLSRIYEASPVSKEQLPGQPGIVRRAVALGRYIQSPLAMMACLCGPNREVLSLKLHPMQMFLTDDERYDALEQVMITVTNQVGIDINLAASHDWQFAPLQFICGLGARKASMIQRSIQGEGRISTRKEMLTSLRLMKKNVFINACGFLRICGSGQAASGNQIMDPLDDTRIHPESYELAKKMAETVYIEDQQRKNEELDEDMIEMALEHVKENPNLLKNLDIEEYAGMVLERDGISKLDTLKDIQMELLHGYRDWRTPHVQLSQDAEFALVTGEDETLSEGKLVNVTVTFVKSNTVICRLECGLSGYIQKEDISDERDSDPLENISVGSIITCRVKAVQKPNYKIDLTCKGSDLRVDNLQTMKYKDPYYCEDDSYLRTEQEKARKAREDEKKKSFKPRMIVHPQFQNVSMADATEILSEKDVGEIIIRPSSKGPTHLSITLKIYDGVYTHIDILEGGKDSKDFTSFLSLGKTLKIGDDTFEDLDEVIARYVDPLVSNLKDMLRYRKFRQGTKEEVDALLRHEKTANPSRIMYAFSVSHEHPGAFVLSYLRSVNVHHEYIGLYPNGFKFRKRLFDNIDKLVNYFQRHVNDPLQENPPHRSLAAMVPMKSPAPAAPASGAWGGSDRPSSAASTGWDVDGWNSTKGTASEPNWERVATPGSRSGGNNWEQIIPRAGGAVNEWTARVYDGYGRGDDRARGRESGVGNRRRDEEVTDFGVGRWEEVTFAGRGRGGRGDGIPRWEGGEFGVGGRAAMPDSFISRWGNGDGDKNVGGGWTQGQNALGNTAGWGTKSWGKQIGGAADMGGDDGWDLPEDSSPKENGWGGGLRTAGLVGAKDFGYNFWGT